MTIATSLGKRRTTNSSTTTTSTTISSNVNSDSNKKSSFLTPKSTIEQKCEDGSNDSSTSFYCSLICLCIASFWTRFHKVSEPAWVCWDETHFGKMGSWYINRTFFFDVHPPLGKMFIGFVGYLSGYNGTFAFEKPGDPYLDHNYLGMRIACTFLGACLVPLSFLTVWELRRSLSASILAGLLILFDNGMLTLNQYILLDPILLFFISFATFAMCKFRNLDDNDPKRFSIPWFCWLTITGLALGSAISVKFVGLFVVLLVGLNTANQLWNILGDLNTPFITVIKHFLARALCLIAVPIALYVALFYVHLAVLYKSGNGDGHFSSSFQSSLEGNPLHNASMPRHLAYDAVITLKNQRTGGGYLHSHLHLYPEGIGARQQQVTTYAHKDANNRWRVKKWNDEDKVADVELVRHGDLVRLEHIMTGRNLHSHQHSAPLSKKLFQVTGYGEEGEGDANDVFRVELVDGKEGDVVETVTSRLRLVHYFLKCSITTSGLQLPKWGYEQQEVACNPNKRDSNALWNVEDNFFEKLPNVSFAEFAPGFLARFVESHAVMLTGNAGLKPKEGEYTSRPWEWPINLKGQFFSGNNYRIYLLGNPIIWWSNLFFLALFVVLFAVQAVKKQRGCQLNEQVMKDDKTLNAALWLFIGWALHYIPFWAMGRVLYFHHYFPAILYSSMITAIILDHVIKGVAAIMPNKGNDFVVHTCFGAILAGLWYSFHLFSPLCYGMDETPGSMPNSTVHHLKWLDSWEF